MKTIIRRLLRDTSAYGKAAKIYHASKNLIMRAQLWNTSTIYLTPRKPVGDYKSQYGQDYYLEKYGLISQNSFFVEVGCNHPIYNSNSHYLEKILSCRGVSVDGIDYSELYDEHRPNTVFVHSLVDEKNGIADFYHVKDEKGWENQVSSMHKETLAMGKGFTADIRKIRTTPLADLKAVSEEIDILLLDVEGHEFSVLNSMDWSKQSPKVFVIENSGEFYPRAKLQKYMESKGFCLFARIGTSDDFYTRA